MISKANNAGDAPFAGPGLQPMGQQDLTQTMQNIMRTIVNEQCAREEARSLIGKARSTTVNKIMELMMLLEPDPMSIHDSAVSETVERRRDKLAATLLYFFLDKNPDLFLEPLGAMSDPELDSLAYRIAATT
ncbi:MAG: hypothetical protein ABR599_10730 [Gemmatimonadota bacterium]